MKIGTVVITVAVAIAAICIIVAAPQNNPGETDMNQEYETVHIAPGETWVLSLEENPTTGYTWSIVSSDGLKVSSIFKPSAEEDIVGAGGVREYSITADEPGEYEFSVKHCRNWETTEHDEMKTIKLIVETAE